MKRTISYITTISALFCACNTAPSSDAVKGVSQKSNSSNTMQYVNDPHSYSLPEEAVVSHLELNIGVNFDTKVISGTAHYNILQNKETNKILFDINGLEIQKIVLNDSEEVEGKIGEFKEYFGSPLEIPIQKNTTKVSITYSTDPGAEAVQWQPKEQTTGKKYPFLFTQSQAILARTWLPCQDSPGVRYTYNAEVTVPKDLIALMSAKNPTEKNEKGIYQFEMNQPIPAYLMALAVGDLTFKKIGDRTGVYAEPEVIEKGAYELADMQKMLESAEELYGEYRWDRYDVLFLPPSFPFGGMENPRLTFATPTIIAGDRSLTSLIAHELAHSWSGNLVTNATWNDFWLNEGFTVYFEYRIMEKLYGEDYTNMLRRLGHDELKEELKELPTADTHLKMHLEGRNPDDGLTGIPYEKGHHFLRMMEHDFGREAFDEFLSNYFNEFAFKTTTTEAFLEYMDENLAKKYNKEVNVEDWVYSPGLPANLVEIESDLFTKVDAHRETWLSNGDASKIPYKSFSTHEKLHLIRGLGAVNTSQMAELDKAFDLTTSTNAEVQCVWYEKAIESGYSEAYDETETFLINVGRRKFLTPLYKAMKESGKLEMAKDIYGKARSNYHAVSKNTMDDLLEWE